MDALDAMKVGLRVLAAVRDRKEPVAADFETLRALAPDFAHASVDELACVVVQRALKERTAGGPESGD